MTSAANEFSQQLDRASMALLKAWLSFVACSFSSFRCDFGKVDRVLAMAFLWELISLRCASCRAGLATKIAVSSIRLAMPRHTEDTLESPAQGVAVGPAAEAQMKRVSLYRTSTGEMEFHSKRAVLYQAWAAELMAFFAAVLTVIS